MHGNRQDIQAHSRRNQLAMGKYIAFLSKLCVKKTAQNAKERGEYLTKALTELSQEFPCIECAR